MTQAAGFPQADDAGQVEGAGAQAPLLAAAIEQGGEGVAAPYHQGTNPLGAVEFVGGEGQEGNAPGVKLQGDFAHGLGGVAEEGDTVALGDGGDLWDRVDGADFIVGGHHRQQVQAAGADRFYLRQVNPGLVINPEDDEFDAALLVKGLAGI